jgi:hypothetical protein
MSGRIFSAFLSGFAQVRRQSLNQISKSFKTINYGKVYVVISRAYAAA